MSHPEEKRDLNSKADAPQRSLRSVSEDAISTVDPSSTDLAGQSGDNLELAPTKDIADAEGLDDVEKQETKFSIHDARAFPDGGTEAWLCVLGGFFCLWCSFGSFPHFPSQYIMSKITDRKKAGLIASGFSNPTTKPTNSAITPPAR
jgi:hypothetical protein